jgi:hypothetical protein
LTAPARIALALVALAAAGWLAATLRSEHLEQQAADVAVGTATTVPRLRAALREVRQSRALQPDANPKLLEWRLLLRLRRPDAATALLKGMVAHEPANAEAWFYATRSPHDPRFVRTARERLRELVRG